KTIQWGKDCLFNKCFWENWVCTDHRIKLKPSLIPYTKSNSKWINDRNARDKTVLFLEESMRASRCWNWQRFLGYGSRSTGNKQNRLNLTKIKIFGSSKNRMRRQPPEWEKIPAN
ncbi:LORF2 protein, partial [Crocuta crocuta]